MTSIYVKQENITDYIKAHSIYNKIKAIDTQDDPDIDCNINGLEFCINFLEQGCSIKMAINNEEFYEKINLKGETYHIFKYDDGSGSQYSSFYVLL